MADLSEDYARYLECKAPLDARSLNSRVWERFLAELRSLRESRQAGMPLRVLEVGAGIGSMFERLCGVNDLPPLHYTALEVDASNVSRLRAVEDPRGVHTLEVLPAELGAWLATRGAQADEEPWDLLIACAVLDLLDVESVLALLLEQLTSGALLYLPVHFDGVTGFDPVIDRALDDRIERIYHRAMDRRLSGAHPAGEARTGRRLFSQLRDLGVSVLAAGPSDWVIFPGPDGYSDRDQQFMRYILNTIEHAVGQELRGDDELTVLQLQCWIARRKQQLERDELVYIAHQLDLVAQTKHS